MEGCSAINLNNVFDQVSSQLDLLYELLSSGSDEEDGAPPAKQAPFPTHQQLLAAPRHRGHRKSQV
jgi:hypothetical protein